MLYKEYCQLKEVLLYQALRGGIVSDGFRSLSIERQNVYLNNLNTASKNLHIINHLE